VRKPISPYLVLALATLLPGAGHVAVGHPARGLTYIFFIALFGALTYATTTPDYSFLGRHAGGLFVWALSIPDAYRIAKMRAEMARHKEPSDRRWQASD
jgi:hypothetical protein